MTNDDAQAEVLLRLIEHCRKLLELDLPDDQLRELLERHVKDAERRLKALGHPAP